MIDLNRCLVAMRRPVALALLCGAAALTLQGCAGVVIGGAAVVGSLAATDRRTIGTQADDKAIAFKGDQRIYSVIAPSDNVKITSFNRRVLLTGEVRDENSRMAAEREMRAVEGVREVINELAVSGTAGFGSRSNDTLITGKVKASLLDEKGLYINAIKVVTERGVVYMMGRVTQREADLATQIARGVGGVQKVVRVFEYISDEEYNSLSNTPDTQKKADRDSQLDH
ncbi:BON domain-containing protein [uncultured Oxalicibacterium sp.]|uniref:BON domain-containing protein n=1 Tax=uncultured Oxalicibacterium sp. TaxID=1168540 RepID=UPI0025DB2B6B|nr:BON domain-containing protein [uncultured Oxalicibacterium sp.]